MIVRPSLARDLSRDTIESAVDEYNPDVDSSAKRIGGSDISSVARDNLFFSPPDMSFPETPIREF